MRCSWSAGTMRATARRGRRCGPRGARMCFTRRPCLAGSRPSARRTSGARAGRRRSRARCPGALGGCLLQSSRRDCGRRRAHDGGEPPRPFPPHARAASLAAPIRSDEGRGGELELASRCVARSRSSRVPTALERPARLQAVEARQRALRTRALTARRELGHQCLRRRSRSREHHDRREAQWAGISNRLEVEATARHDARRSCAHDRGPQRRNDRGRRVGHVLEGWPSATAQRTSTRRRPCPRPLASLV